jgi:hypothetical protein
LDLGRDWEEMSLQLGRIISPFKFIVLVHFVELINPLAPKTDISDNHLIIIFELGMKGCKQELINNF